MPVKSDVNVDMAEGPSTTAVPSNPFVVKCSVRVRGHHVYKRIWSPCVGEQFETFCEEDNKHDEYAMAVHLKNSLTVVGHILREITHTCHSSSGEITGEVSGRQQRCTAACGGLEVPCLLTFYHGDTRVLGKAKELVTKTFVLAQVHIHCNNTITDFFFKSFCTFPLLIRTPPVSGKNVNLLL